MSNQIKRTDNNTKRTQWSMLWTQKYRPHKLDDVVGQNSQIKMLREWLSAWEDIQFRGNKREIKEVKGFIAAGSINSRAALLSGDPGIGKTTSARLLAAQFGYRVMQWNASDVRNRAGVGLIQSGSGSLGGSEMKKTLLVMDEVDGMSGGDRGGVTAIIALIKTSKVPVICICNDRSAEKIRSLAGHCMDVRFHKPHKGTMVKRLKEILVEEGGSGEDRALERLVQTFQNDMRQILSYLQMIFRTVSRRVTIDALGGSGSHSKDQSVQINHFDAAKRLLNRHQSAGLKISQRLDCFFVDSDLVPLMIHQNLLNSARKAALPSQFHSIVQAMDGFVLGDMLDRNIRRTQDWGLMPAYGLMSCVYTTEKVSESIGFPSFPAWLGKNSSQRKNKRLARELKNLLMPISLCGSWRQAKSFYAPLLFHQLIDCLKNSNPEQALQLMEIYHLSPQILNEHLPALQLNPQKLNPLASIPAAVKSKLTRLYNKSHEDAKLRQVKTGKVKAEHLKFDPLLEEVQQIGVQQQPEEETGQDIDKVKVKEVGKKGKKKRQ